MKTRTSTAGNNRGFTLLELLVVLFIAGIAVSVVAVAAGRLRDKSLFTQEARKIFLTVKHARETSLLERTEVAFRISEEGDAYWLEQNGVAAPKRHTMHGKFKITGKDLYFYPKGNSSGGLIEIQNEKGQKYAIEVSEVLGTPAIRRL